VRVIAARERIAPPSTVLAKLVHDGLIETSGVRDRAIAIADVSRSNAVYLVTVDGIDRYAVKQAGPVADEGCSIQAELAIYRWLALQPGLAELAPGLVATPAGGNWLIVDAVPDARPLHVHTDEQPGSLPDVVEALASALGRLHGRDCTSAAIASRRPWILKIRSGVFPAFASHNRAVPEFAARLLKRPGLASAIDDVSRSWRATCVTHGDIKSDNVLVLEGCDGPPRIVLIDWELGGLGDPTADLAGVIEIVLRHHCDVPEDIPRVLTCPAIRRALEAYRSAVGLSFVTTPDRIVQFLIVRLAQSVIQLEAMAAANEEFRKPQQTLISMMTALAADPRPAASVLASG
jgi:aminoglycoside phosphotransferase (APT) family kinase protein